MTQPVRLDPARTAPAAEMLARAFRVDPAYTLELFDTADVDFGLSSARTGTRDRMASE